MLNVRVFRWLGVTCLALGLTATLAPVQAQSGVVKSPEFALQGRTLDGSAFDMARLKGKVVVVFFWSTRCAVCLSHMPELRDNLGGWRNKPFELVTVNVDADPLAWRAYEQIVAKTHSLRPLGLWSMAAAAPTLPLTLVLDTQSRVVARYEGRIAPEAWDAVADLLP
jgi:thiol-disulfide isomerase/thioredoxin